MLLAAGVVAAGVVAFITRPGRSGPVSLAPLMAGCVLVTALILAVWYVVSHPEIFNLLGVAL